MAFNIPLIGNLGNIGGGVGGFINIFNAWFGKFQSMSQLDWFGLFTIGLAVVNIILPIVFIMNDQNQRRRMGQGR